MTPEQAVQTNLDLHCRVMRPVHWATFNLAFDAGRESADRAFVAARNAGVMLVIPKRRVLRAGDGSASAPSVVELKFADALSEHHLQLPPPP
jgi:L-ascorbate metabolism protein UlaG (beta-lactamase superfamily)